jgi:hypothetical protein
MRESDMNTKYLRCGIFHPGRQEVVYVDIEAWYYENEEVEEPLFEDILVLVTNEFLDNGLSVEWDHGETQLHDNYSQPDYVGTVAEIIRRINSEFG